MQRLAIAVAALLATAGAVPSPAPAPAPTAAPAAARLKTIATVRTTPRCSAIMRNTNAAIVDALNNDKAIVKTIGQVRAAQLDDNNELHFQNALQQMLDSASAMTTAARAGDDNVKRLRIVAQQTKDPQDKAALLAFADQLGGALWRQQELARDLGGFGVYLMTRESMRRTFDASQGIPEAEATPQATDAFGIPVPYSPMTVAETNVAMQGAGASRDVMAMRLWMATVHQNPDTEPQFLRPFGHGTPDQMAQAAATDFEGQLRGIALDEDHAANSASGALNGC